MARPASTHPTDGELEILRVLWDQGPLSLSTLCDALRLGRDVATTTVATMLRVMNDKRLVKRKGTGRGAEWAAVVSRDATARSMVDKLVDGIFNGSAERLVAHLVEGGELTATELTELRKLIDESTSASRKSAKSQKQ